MDRDPSPAQPLSPAYCASRSHTVRRRTREVLVGRVGVGGQNPLRVQSMTTSDTQDIAATVRQSIALAEVGCEIVRITAPNVAAARCLADIRREFTAAGFGHVPLVADIHFLPAAAMEAVEHVEKVRVNPGNYADKKKFAVKDYSDADYAQELERLHEAFTPLVLRARQLGRSLRIGTNHGSLSDRIMNRYGDTPLGMVESALEFLRIAASHGFHQLILSMKASNPKVMIQAYRLLVARMNQEGMDYPLHLGVTEAGDGEDGRIKSAIGIGSLLTDGLGDTIRVSLTEDSVYEIPVAQALARKATALWTHPAATTDATPSPPLQVHPAPLAPVELTAASASSAFSPYQYNRRPVGPWQPAPGLFLATDQPPRVIVRVADLAALPAAVAALAHPRLIDTPTEFLLVPIAHAEQLPAVLPALRGLSPTPPAVVLELPIDLPVHALDALAPDSAPGASQPPSRQPALVVLQTFTPATAPAAELAAYLAWTTAHGHTLAIATTAEHLPALRATLAAFPRAQVLFTLATPAATRSPAPAPTLAAPAAAAASSHPTPTVAPAPSPANDTTPPSPHPVGRYRALATALPPGAPLWLRNTFATSVEPGPSFLSRLLEASVLTGTLLCDGFGDLVSIETEPDPTRALTLTYNVLQGAGTRQSKTEFVACPSCGRTLFDLQTTTQRIRAQTGHLKGVKIAIMGCIVNGPGEMADADFGYVGGAPGKVNLYVGKTCVQYHVPQAEADARLIALIQSHGKWIEPSHPTPA